MTNKGPNRLNLTIFHYHLLPGGVTNVIMESLCALLQNNDIQPEKINILSGRSQNIQELKTAVHNRLGDEAPEIHFHVIPELDYLPVSKINKQQYLRSLNEELEPFYDSLWVVHNYHLGKNPLFTEYMVNPETPKSDRILFYIHDFPESGRYNNLQRLKELTPSPLYPVTPKIPAKQKTISPQYCVINSRDREILQKSGLPANTVHLLPNPVKPSSEEIQEPVDLAKILDPVCSKEFSGWKAGLPIALYPVRGIRRKNLLEAGLICRMLTPGYNLVITLPGTSDQEIRYSNMVESLSHSGIMPGAFGVGQKLDKLGLTFSQLTHNVDLIISSSVQEGFGYLYLDALGWKTPIIARDLDILKDFKPLFNIQSKPDQGYFYSGLNIPVNSRNREELQRLYDHKIRKLKPLLSKARLGQLSRQVEKILNSETVDFSYLSVDLQEKVLNLSRDSAYMENLRQVNEEFMDKSGALLNSPRNRDGLPVDHPFSPKNYSRRFAEIVRSFDPKAGSNRPPCYEAAPEKVPNSREIQQNMVDQFTRLENLRLLYDFQ